MESWDPYKALYLHVPFCKQRCRYCDFRSEAVACDSPLLDVYTDQIIEDIRAYSRRDLLGSIETVYIGGGTPTYLGNKRLSSILYTLGVSMHLTPDVECTLEANPDSLTEAMVKDLFALGVTRLSLGVQSFDDDLLRTLGRVHTSAQAKNAITMAQQRFTNISIDLMCGLPGQTVQGFLDDVCCALDLGVKHISIYPLMIEEGTPFFTMVEMGQLQVDDDFAAECMEAASDFLVQAGFNRYEVASYALPGFESRHNQAYWTGKPYLGIGQGAVGMRQNALCRQRFEGNTVIEELDVFQYTAEDLMLGMRRSVGISDDQLNDACLLLDDARVVFDGLERDGFVEHVANRWRPTRKGWLFGNQMYGRIWDLAPESSVL